MNPRKKEQLRFEATNKSRYYKQGQTLDHFHELRAYALMTMGNFTLELDKNDSKKRVQMRDLSLFARINLDDEELDNYLDLKNATSDLANRYGFWKGSNQLEMENTANTFLNKYKNSAQKMKINLPIEMIFVTKFKANHMDRSNTGLEIRWSNLISTSSTMKPDQIAHQMGEILVPSNTILFSLFSFEEDGVDSSREVKFSFTTEKIPTIWKMSREEAEQRLSGKGAIEGWGEYIVEIYDINKKRNGGFNRSVQHHMF